MALRLQAKDRLILSALADHRMLTARQMAAVLDRNPHALRRRLRQLAEGGLIRMASRGFASAAGRPEQLLSLVPAGVDVLKKAGALDSDLPVDRVLAEKIHCLDHQLLVNDVRVQLVQMQRLVPKLSVCFHGGGSALCPPGQSPTVVREKILLDERTDQWLEFTPDGVFSITHAGLGKTLLFFLEADRGTESLTSSRPSADDVRQKIVNYQTYFRRGGYKRYEAIWQGPLQGFRLLLLADSPVRASGLCRLVRRTPPCDFIWLTDHVSLLAKGLWSAIWRRGGREDEPLESILGSQTPDPSPAPSSLA